MYRARLGGHAFEWEQWQPEMRQLVLSKLKKEK
jgi:hypothetical protein